MTSWAVTDSGIYLAAVLPETYSAQADALIASWSQQSLNVAAPYLFRYEVTSTMRKHVARGNLTIDEARAALRGLLGRPVTMFTQDDLLERAFEVATLRNLPSAYDAQYLALAEHLRCDFWTADLRLYNAVSPVLNWIHWIGDFKLQKET